MQIARIARENEGYWLARVEAEQSLGDTRKAWEKVAAALPRVAVIALVLGSGFAHFPAAAHNMNDWHTKHYAKLALHSARHQINRLRLRNRAQ